MKIKKSREARCQEIHDKLKALLSDVEGIEQQTDVMYLMIENNGGGQNPQVQDPPRFRRR